jgi:formylglycine-generating enzyme required for sulfatase activity
VFRGGAWNSASAAGVRAAYRYDFTPTDRNYIIGFRCARGAI